MALQKLHDFLGDNEKLYALSSNYFAIYEALNDPEKTFKHISTLLGCDPAFSAKLLKIVNSPFYGFPNKIDTLDHAVSLVGTEQLSDLIFATAIVQQFRGIPVEWFNEEMFWKHNVAVGLIAREIGKAKEIPNAARYYLAGILHDLGRLLICTRMGEQAYEIYEMSHKESQPVHVSEQKVLGFDHAMLCAEMLRSWNLPDRLIQSVRWHHFPKMAFEFKEDALIIHVSDWLAHQFEYGEDEECLGEEISPDLFKELGLTRETLKTVKARVDSQFQYMIELVL